MSPQGHTAGPCAGNQGISDRPAGPRRLSCGGNDLTDEPGQMIGPIVFGHEVDGVKAFLVDEAGDDAYPSVRRGADPAASRTAAGRSMVDPRAATAPRTWMTRWICVDLRSRRCRGVDLVLAPVAITCHGGHLKT
jgi:hypothetical protein